MSSLFAPKALASLFITLLLVHMPTCIFAKDKIKEEPFSRFGLGFGADHYPQGANLNLTLRYALKGRPLVFYGGVNYHINKANSGKLDGLDEEAYFNAFRVYDDRWVALSAGERFGFKLGVEKYFKLKTDKYKLFAFGDFQKNTLSRIFYDAKTLSIDSVHGNDTLIGYGHVYDHNDLLRTNLGLGISVNLFSECYLKLIAGGGFSLTRNSPAFSFGYMLGLQAHWNFLAKSK